MTAAEARWAKINQNLLREADEWGKDGKFDMFRNPLGEYLEALSKTSMPKKARPLGDGGLDIGVIDVSTSRQKPASPSGGIEGVEKFGSFSFKVLIQVENISRIFSNIWKSTWFTRITPSTYSQIITDTFLCR